MITNGTEPDGLWLNLSGGGFRAAIFHFGCLRRLHEAGLLDRLVGISATSGGSIVAALWAMHVTGSDDHNSAWSRFESDLLRLTTRGLLTPTALLVAALLSYLSALVAALAGLLAASDVLGIVSLCLFCAGVILHAGLVVSLLRAGALRPGAWAFANRGDVTFRARLSRLGDVLLSPSRLRWYTMDLLTFHGCRLDRLNDSPFRVFFNAVNLEAGRQAVLSPLIESGLDPDSLDRQWKARPDEELHWRIAAETPLSRAVAASTAFPPWFAPVPIAMTRGRQDLKWAVCRFVDGGVTDNAGFKLARGLARRGHPPPVPGVRYQKSFREQVRVVLTLDASRPPRWRERVATRARAALRLAQVTQNSQSIDLLDATAWLGELGYTAWAAGLQVGFQDEPLSTLNDRLNTVRTHLDGFTADEIGALAYCGYMRMEYMLTFGYLDALEPDHSTPALTLSDFLNALGLPERSLQELEGGLCLSASVWSLRRWWRRRVIAHG